MIDYLKGPIVYKDPDSFVIECGGVGLRVFSTVFSLAEIEVGEERTVFTELVVREDAMILVGFSTRTELEVYRMLVTVNGVGPKTALGALSSIHYVDFCAAVVTRNIKEIQAAHGIGKKTAERIAVELSDKASIIAISGGEAHVGITSGRKEIGEEEDEVLGALISLGYKKQDAQRMLATIDRTGKDMETVLREALVATLR